MAIDSIREGDWVRFYRTIPPVDVDFPRTAAEAASASRIELVLAVVAWAGKELPSFQPLWGGAQKAWVVVTDQGIVEESNILEVRPRPE